MAAEQEWFEQTVQVEELVGYKVKTSNGMGLVEMTKTHKK